MSGIISSSLIIILATVGILSVVLYITITVEDFLKGINFILIKRLRIGDVVSVNNIEGTIEKISLKMLTIKDESGNQHYIRNSRIKKLENKSRNYDFCPIKVIVPKETNIVKVIDNIKAAIKQVVEETNLGNSILDELEIYSIDNINNKKISIEGKIKTSPYAKELVKIEIENRIKNSAENATSVQIN